MFGNVEVFVKKGKKLVSKGVITPRDRSSSSRSPRFNRPTLADEVLEAGPEFTLPSRLARRATVPVKQLMSYYDERYDRIPSSYKDRSWKRQSRRVAQFRHH